MSFLLCLLSGVFLAIPYDPENAFDSIALMLLDNPAAVYLRNIHYWTAQSFLVFTILHLLDHLVRNTEYLIGNGVWLRLVVSLPVILFVMISGFILKGDPDAVSAFSILSALTAKIPLAGELLRASFLGRAENLQLIYVHHIATASIFLLLIILEHTRIAWPRTVTFLVMTFLFLILSYLLHAPFGTDTGKGPWYFTGLQEMLHWMARPGWVWLAVILLLILFWAMPRLSCSWNSLIKRILAGMALFYVLLTVIGIFFRGEEWKFAWPRAQDIRHSAGVTLMPLTTEFTEDFGFSGTIPLIMGRREGCLVCHQKTAGFSPAHDPIALGCSSCHGGDPLTLNKRLAHRGMRGIPGNLADAVLSCGTAQCHPSITSRVPTSIMTTASGIVTVDRWVFGEEDSLSALAHIMQIGHSPADQHLRDLCANCHLGNPKTESGPVNQQTRGGGCNACHLGYDRRSIASLADYRSTGLIQLSDTFYHPSLSLNITDEHCFGCHSRSGRIATNYQGWHETLLDAAEMPGDGRYRLLEDQRVFKFAGADVHHQKGLQCIDCHHSYELMGDGNYYAHKEEQVSVSCQDCHFDREPVNLTVEQLDDEALKILSLRQWAVEGKRFVKPAGSDYALVNAWLDREGRGWQKIKATGREVYLKPPVSECTRGEGHCTLSCESCHTAWVPQCIGCHNAFDRDADGYDMLEGKDKRGSWVEYVGQFMHGPPTLGIDLILPL